MTTLDLPIAFLLWIFFPFLCCLSAYFCRAITEKGTKRSFSYPPLSFWFFVLFWYLLLFPISFSLLVTWIGSFIAFPVVVGLLRYRILAEQGHAPDDYWDFVSEKYTKLIIWQLNMPRPAWIIFGVWTLLFILVTLL